jgi:hypothetical protein
MVNCLRYIYYAIQKALMSIKRLQQTVCSTDFGVIYLSVGNLQHMPYLGVQIGS